MVDIKLTSLTLDEGLWVQATQEKGWSLILYARIQREKAKVSPKGFPEIEQE
jgi:hypothetical protein